MKIAVSSCRQFIFAGKLSSVRGENPNGGAFINACGDCECGIDGTIMNVNDACNMTLNSFYVTETGQVLYNTSHTLFAIGFNIVGANIDTVRNSYFKLVHKGGGGITIPPPQ